MSKLLIDKTAVITGASRGIGKGIALAFAENGCNIAFTYKSSSKEAKELEKELTGLNVKSKAYKSDASNLEDSNQLVESVLKDFNSIDYAVLYNPDNEKWHNNTVCQDRNDINGGGPTPRDFSAV